MMGIVMAETCWAYKKYNKIISGIYLVFLFFSYHNDARPNKHQIKKTYCALLVEIQILYKLHGTNIKKGKNFDLK